MYNDEQNLYHYTYRKDGSESGQQNAGPAGDGAVGTVQSEPQRPIQTGRCRLTPHTMPPPNAPPNRAQHRASAVTFNPMRFFFTGFIS